MVGRCPHTAHITWLGQFLIRLLASRRRHTRESEKRRTMMTINAMTPGAATTATIWPRVTYEPTSRMVTL